MKKKIKLNIGCGGRPLKGYINIDQDNLSKLKKRYPLKKFDDSLIIKNYNIFKLPFKDNSVDEIKADGLIEHLSFAEEPKFFYEIKRVLKKNGIMKIITIDFERTVKKWLNTSDNWLEFHRNDVEAIKSEFWFGNYSYTKNNRWGYLTASIFGSQLGKGQFHQNCYTKKKFIKIFKFLNFEVVKIEKSFWKKDRDYTLDVIAKKKN